MKGRLVNFGALAFVTALPACASTSADDSYRDVAKVVADRSGHKIYWNDSPEAEAKVTSAVRRMLADGLTLPEAVQVALLNNRELQATYEDLSVAQADLVQAGLLSNPVVSGTLKFPLEGGAPDVDLGIEFDFLSLLFLPAKKRVAAAELETKKARVADAVLDLATRVKVAYYELQAAQQLASLQRVLAAAGQAAFEISAGQQRAGNISELDAAMQQGGYEETRIALAATEATILDRREELTRLLGLWGDDIAFRVPEGMPALPVADPALGSLESLAIRNRFDVDAARRQLSATSMAASLARSSRFVGGLDVGAEAEREAGEGHWDLGPSGSVALPLFDQGQAGVARLEAEVRRARHELAFVSINARAEVRQARNRLVAQRALSTHYKDVVIPLRERLVALAQQQFDAMLIGIYQLLDLKRTEIDAYKEYIQAVRDYWIARADLERAVGGRLPGVASTGNAPALPRPNGTPPVPAPDEKAPLEHRH